MLKVLLACGAVSEEQVLAQLENIMKQRGYPRRQRYVLAALEDIQACLGCVPDEVLEPLTEYFATDISFIQTWLNLTDVFRTRPVPAHALKVCRGPRCDSRGASEIIEHLSAAARKKKIAVVTYPCLGACDQSPVVQLNDSCMNVVECEKLLQGKSQ